MYHVQFWKTLSFWDDQIKTSLTCNQKLTVYPLFLWSFFFLTLHSLRYCQSVLRPSLCLFLLDAYYQDHKTALLTLDNSKTGLITCEKEADKKISIGHIGRLTAQLPIKALSFAYLQAYSRHNNTWDGSCAKCGTGSNRSQI